MFTLLVQVEVRPECVEEFASAIVLNARVSLERDAGCRRFEVFQVADAPTRWVFHEEYDERESWERHRQSPHFLEYQAVAARALVSRVAVPLTPVSVAPASNGVDGG